MGGVPMDEETWKVILEECDNNHDGMVNIYLLMIKLFSYKISADEFVDLLMKKFT